MLYEYDFIRVVKPYAKERIPFTNAIGVVVAIDKDGLHEVKFQQKRLRQLDETLGGLLWFEDELEAL